MNISRDFTKFTVVMTCGLLFSACGGGGSSSDGSDESEATFTSKEALGEALFSDVNLSGNRTQACSTCHNPDRAFIDDRLDAFGEIGAVSMGDDGISLGDRNTPSAAYAAFSPDFFEGTRDRLNSDAGQYQGFMGGQFLDGREADLKGQAGGPPLNPIEMNMPDKASVVARIQENEDYVEAFESLYSETVFDDVDAAYEAMTESIAKFEKTEGFASFDSDYDRHIKGEYDEYILTKAGLGKALFFSQEFTNCATCHQLQPNSHPQETFSSYEYHNIGVPENTAVRAVNNTAEGFIDNGLLDNPATADTSHQGKFKVPTLRNVAVTEPYMHNGVFRDLKTVILFYDQFNNEDRSLNPETGAAWTEAEVPETINHSELAAPALTDEEVEALVCFLRSLTDARYKHLIEEKGIRCE
ncbi:MAG: c-type cytochrome [Candidatus Thiodiazotropha lotti]|uniref:cytochrome-c peroxidase n=1 Tax=Candidatus Thiodiazotropha endoloripes TaxID=1818881 RepID=UPI000B1195AE|nr:cytochrome c peroxidase [Candidatus Thiodiazotropha endoloripes]MCG7899750.1 c-type cytochrome [Candidatus Thiodiazotropha weberae]MCG7990742.1 c-type cytochrome [Candidatus Thiodiazotropha lotti]MCG7904701.1 c-type cytochrome [Candidatus Thiodiazotropha weberae]MCG7916013.1 c-type cytochrome [Candidatus Thiodiazotropha weberae]MCG7999393.1 c-type cytochrome [Candidatus Thiodiazotropha lotti]